MKRCLWIDNIVIWRYIKANLFFCSLRYQRDRGKLSQREVIVACVLHMIYLIQFHNCNSCWPNQWFLSWVTCCFIYYFEYISSACQWISYSRVYFQIWSSCARHPLKSVTTNPGMLYWVAEMQKFTDPNPHICVT